MTLKPPGPCIFCGWQHFNVEHSMISLDAEYTCTRCWRTFLRDGLGHLLGVTVPRDGKMMMVRLDGMILVGEEFEVW